MIFLKWFFISCFGIATIGTFTYLLLAMPAGVNKIERIKKELVWHRVLLAIALFAVVIFNENVQDARYAMDKLRMEYHNDFFKLQQVVDRFSSHKHNYSTGLPDYDPKW